MPLADVHGCTLSRRPRWLDKSSVSRHHAEVSQALTSTLFVQRWAGRGLNETQSAQSHFTDLCRMLGVPAPTDDRSDDEQYCFEARTEILGAGAGNGSGDDLFGRVAPSGGRGFADVYKRDHFVWEYKKSGKSLADALAQLHRYKGDLHNPPLLIVCDGDRFEIHTNFTHYATRRYAFTITDLANPSEEIVARLGDPPLSAPAPIPQVATGGLEPPTEGL